MMIINDNDDEWRGEDRPLMKDPFCMYAHIIIGIDWTTSERAREGTTPLLTTTTISTSTKTKTNNSNDSF